MAEQLLAQSLDPTLPNGACRPMNVTNQPSRDHHREPEGLDKSILTGQSARMRLATKASVYTTLATCILLSCSDDGGTTRGDSKCITAANAKVCGAVDEGRLAMTAEGLKPGSTLRINVEGQGPAEWTVSETGGLISDPGVLGFLSYNGAIGTVVIEATAEDGTSLAGEVVLD